MRDTIAKLISTGKRLVVGKGLPFMKLCSLGILLCELLNGLIPFIDQPATLIMLEKETLKIFKSSGWWPRNLEAQILNLGENIFWEKIKLKGSQPMVMDRTTLLDPDYPPKYKPYLERRIPKHFHLLVQHLTMRNPSKRPCAKVILKVCSNIEGCVLPLVAGSMLPLAEFDQMTIGKTHPTLFTFDYSNI